MEIEDLLGEAEKNFQKNRVYFKRLGKRRENLDQFIHPIHQEVFDDIDCLSCANCCITTGPLLLEKDIERIAKRLRMKPSDFVDQYLRIDEDKDYVFKSMPCPFLDAENYCTVYEDRPKACREYPHTNRKNMRQILSLTLKNTLICPAVYKIFERLKNDLP